MYMGLYEWTISRNSSLSVSALSVNSTGNVSDTLVAGSIYAIRPCFYLASNVAYVSGDGTINNPYIFQ